MARLLRQQQRARLRAGQVALAGRQLRSRRLHLLLSQRLLRRWRFPWL